MTHLSSCELQIYLYCKKYSIIGIASVQAETTFKLQLTLTVWQFISLVNNFLLRAHFFAQLMMILK